MTFPDHISLITLGVADVERAAAFYEQLGWQRSSVSVPGEVAFFRNSGPALSLYGIDALSEDARVDVPSTSQFRGVTIAVNVRSEAAVDAAMDAAERAGAKITRPASPVAWGGYIGYFEDLDGHSWEVAHNPSFPLDDRGSVVLPE